MPLVCRREGTLPRLGTPTMTLPAQDEAMAPCHVLSSPVLQPGLCRIPRHTESCPCLLRGRSLRRVRQPPGGKKRAADVSSPKGGSPFLCLKKEETEEITQSQVDALEGVGAGRKCRLYSGNRTHNTHSKKLTMIKERSLPEGHKGYGTDNEVAHHPGFKLRQGCGICSSGCAPLA